MISTHILDTTKGMPASGVTVVLEKSEQGNWRTIGEDQTNADGRIAFDCPKEAGTYRLTFQIEAYFQNEASFFLNTPVVFKIQDTGRKYHVPLLLNPYGYSTYRGS
jgi:5-hydroxyisourate hydrolase